LKVWKPNNSFRLWLAVVGLSVLFSPLWVNIPARAQETAPDAPIYRVQPGDTLWGIARRFGVSTEALSEANGLDNPNQLVAGQELRIPGLPGVRGYLQTVEIPLGETARSLSRRYGLAQADVIRLNRLTSPAQLYAGGALILTEAQAAAPAGVRLALGAGESALQAAASAGISPWELALRNGAAAPLYLLPQDVLLLPGESAAPAALPPALEAISLNAPLVQGRTAVLQAQAAPGTALQGAFLGHALTFFPLPNGAQAALQGIPALQTPGVYPLRLEITLPDGARFVYEQSVPVFAGEYLYDPPLSVPSEEMDPAITGPEDAQLAALTAPVTPKKYWDGQFVPPVDAPYLDCWPSRYGNRRSYNGSGYIYFHTGLDFCGQVGFNIYAAADGVVVFSRETVVRGNMTIIDHGWGVYSVYMHQSEVFVQTGDVVQAGQLIGLVGATGRVTGPHLHFEVWVNGVQVDPWLWLTQTYP